MRRGKRVAKWLGGTGLAALCATLMSPALGQRSISLPPILGDGAFGVASGCRPIQPDLLTRLTVQRSVCPLSTQGVIMGSYDIQGDTVLAAFDGSGAVVGLGDGASGAALSFNGRVDRTGSAGDTVHWGLWRQGVLAHGSGTHRADPRSIDDTTAIPYIVGVPTAVVHRADLFAARSARLSALPGTGVARYVLAGEAGVVSERDFDGTVVPIGTVQSARATVDFTTGTVRLEFRSAVRSTAATLQFELVPGDSLEGGVDLRQSCEGSCPSVHGSFYGRDGEYLGITFRYRLHDHLAEADAVAARLNNVHAHGAFVLKREP